MGDSQAALFGQQCFETGTTKVTFGSGSSVLFNIGNQMRLSANGIVTTIGWVHAQKPTYAFEGIINFTGATISWLQDQLQLISSPQESETLAEAVEDNGGVYLVPAFVGLSAPYWCSDARAAIVGLTPYSTKHHVVRAALESIAYIVNDVLRLMSKEAKTDLKYIRADGGAVKNRFLMQFVADIAQLTVRASSLPELSAFGAVLSGALGMGQFATLEDLQQLNVTTIDFDPLMSPSQAQKYYKGWHQAVHQVISS
jgi:glycerol kinase